MKLEQIVSYHRIESLMVTNRFIFLWYCRLRRGVGVQQDEDWVCDSGGCWIRG